jgi:succinoglycan biosynthesis protein ExoM
MQPQIIAIGLCTRQRPNMLRTCLESLIAQEAPSDIAPEIVVVDNEPDPNNLFVIEEFRAPSPFPIHYVHEPRTGIPFARNSVLDKALEIGAHWIAFIDDDETAEPGWLTHLMAPEYRHVPVLMGFQRLIYPEDAFWAPAPKPPKQKEGQRLNSAYTYNVRFAADLARTFRFNEAIGLGSGEDADFFKRIAAAGSEMRFTARAVTREFVHPERASYRGQCYRTFRYTLDGTRGYISEKGPFRALARALVFLPERAFGAIGYLLVGAACGPFSPRLFKKFTLAAGKQVSQAAGYGAALWGLQIKPYRVVMGD